MFIARVAAGLIFSLGAGALKLAVADESLLLLLVGMCAAVAGVCWFTLGARWPGDSAPLIRS